MAGQAGNAMHVHMIGLLLGYVISFVETWDAEV